MNWLDEMEAADAAYPGDVSYPAARTRAGRGLYQPRAGLDDGHLNVARDLIADWHARHANREQTRTGHLREITAYLGWMLADHHHGQQPTVTAAAFRGVPARARKVIAREVVRTIEPPRGASSLLAILREAGYRAFDAYRREP